MTVSPPCTRNATSCSAAVVATAPAPGPADARSLPDEAAGSPAEASVRTDHPASGAASVPNATGGQHGWRWEKCSVMWCWCGVGWCSVGWCDAVGSGVVWFGCGGGKVEVLLGRIFSVSAVKKDKAVPAVFTKLELIMVGFYFTFLPLSPPPPPTYISNPVILNNSSSRHRRN